MRRSALIRDGFKCQYAKRFGRRIDAEVVHHAYPREDYPEYQYELWNLVSLSNEAHNKMHNRTTGELTKEGVALANRIGAARGIPPVRIHNRAL